MGFFSKLFGPKANFGKLDPENAEAFWQLTMQVQRLQGAPRAELLAQHGIRDEAQWNQIIVAMNAKHGQNPAAFSAAAYQASAQQTNQAMAGGMAAYGMTNSESIGGLTLQQLATVDAKIELNPAAQGQILAQFNLTPDGYQVAKSGWVQKMNLQGPNPVEAATLNGQYQMLLAQAKMPGNQ